MSFSRCLPRLGFTLVVLSAVASGSRSLYKRRWVSEQDWGEGGVDGETMYQEVTNSPGSNLACSGLCSAREDCIGFWFDDTDGTCQLGKLQNLVNLWNSVGSFPVMVQQTKCPADISILKDQTQWEATVSSTFNTQAGYTKDNVLDSLLSTFWHSQAVPYPWLQVQLASRETVASVEVTGSGIELQRFNHVEVRVGDIDVEAAGATEREHKLCWNNFCHRSGETYANEKKLVCTSPSTGKFVTIQKYALSDGQPYLEIANVEVKVHLCPHPLETFIQPSFDECSLRADGSGVLMTEKGSWSVLSSSTLNNDNSLYGPQYVANSDYSEGSTDIFVSSATSKYPWIQIELAAPTTLKGLVITSRDEVCCKGQYLEVRIGNVDASQTVPGSKIQANKICHTTFDSVAGTKAFDCVGPLSGNYVSIQKYNSDDSDWTLELMEVDLLELGPVLREDKYYWKATSSGVYSGGISDLAIDNNYVSTSSYYHSENAVHAWFQVELYSSQTVTTVNILGIENKVPSHQRFNHLEVRVGDTDISFRPNTALIQDNELCYKEIDITDTTHSKSFTCVAPRNGKFVTVQKWGHNANQPNTEYLEIREIDIMFQ